MVDGGSGCADAAFTVEAATMLRPVARNVRRPVSVGMNTVPRLASLFDDRSCGSFRARRGKARLFRTERCSNSGSRAPTTARPRWPTGRREMSCPSRVRRPFPAGRCPLRISDSAPRVCAESFSRRSARHSPACSVKEKEGRSEARLIVSTLSVAERVRDVMPAGNHNQTRELRWLLRPERRKQS